MTNKTISITIPNDDHIALHELGAAMQRMAHNYGHPVIVPHEVAKEIMAERKATISEVMRHNPSKEKLTVIGVDDDLGIAPDVQLCQSCYGYERSGKVCAKCTVDASDTIITDSPQIDSDGFPWDVRVHSDNKTLNPNGTWRSRKKPVDMDDQAWKEFKSDVCSELMCMRESPVVAEPVEPEPIVVNEVSADAYVEFIRWVTACEFSSDKIDEALADVGIADIKRLNGNPGTIIKVREILTFSE